MVISLSVTALTMQISYGRLRTNGMIESALLSLGLGYLVSRYSIRYMHIIESQNRELISLNADLNAYAHTVAHDLKSPLSVIVGHADLLAGELDNPDSAREHLRLILKNVAAAGEIIDALLLLASVRAEKFEVSRIEDMDTLIYHAWARHRMLASTYTAVLRLPEKWHQAKGYAPWVEGIWSNYLSNAIKYGGTPPEIVIGSDKLPDGMIKFWVRDNGRGIPQKQQAELFNEFTGTHGITGHGLGLSIVRRIAFKLGGDAGVESELNVGSVFYFTLPGEDIYP